MFCSDFLSGSVKTIFRVIRLFGVIFAKPKKRASAPPRERIYVVSELLYQSLKTKPDGTRSKKVIQDFISSVILLVIVYHPCLWSTVSYNLRLTFKLKTLNRFVRAYLDSYDYITCNRFG